MSGVDLWDGGCVAGHAVIVDKEEDGLARV